MTRYDPRMYGSGERRGYKWPPTCPRFERDARAMFAPRRARRLRWLRRLLWAAVVMVILWAVAQVVHQRVERMGRWAWVSAAGREVADEVSHW